MDSIVATVFAYVGGVTAIVGSIYAAVNHKRVRSNCCGKVLEASLDVENTTPVKKVEAAPAA
jgi:hypothetical protein